MAFYDNVFRKFLYIQCTKANMKKILNTLPNAYLVIYLFLLGLLCIPNVAATSRPYEGNSTFEGKNNKRAKTLGKCYKYSKKGNPIFNILVLQATHSKKKFPKTIIHSFEMFSKFLYLQIPKKKYEVTVLLCLSPKQLTPAVPKNGLSPYTMVPVTKKTTIQDIINFVINERGHYWNIPNDILYIKRNYLVWHKKNKTLKQLHLKRNTTTWFIMWSPDLFPSRTQMRQVLYITLPHYIFYKNQIIIEYWVRKNDMNIGIFPVEIIHMIDKHLPPLTNFENKMQIKRKDKVSIKTEIFKDILQKNRWPAKKATLQIFTISVLAILSYSNIHSLWS